MHLGTGRDRLAELGDVVRAEEVRPAVRVRAEAVRQLRGEPVDHAEGEERPGQVVRQPRLPGPAARRAGDVRVEEQLAVLVRDHPHRVGQRLPVADEAGQRVGHRQAALHLGRARGVGRRRGHAGEELAGRGQQHPGLAQRRQHLPDVAEEGGVGPHDQDGAPGQLLAVRVQQIRRAVQRHDGLAGAGAALDDEHAAVRGADDPVLLGLDGLHDVVHPPGARGVQRREQHGIGVGALVAGALGVREVHDLVVQGGDPAALGGDVAPAAQAHRGVPGGEVERPRHLGPPVDDQRGAVGVVPPDADAPDVVVAPVAVGQPAETQPVLPGIERGEQPRLLRHHHIPLQARLEAAAACRERLLDRALRSGAQLGEAFVQQIDELLLVTHFLV